MGELHNKFSCNKWILSHYNLFLLVAKYKYIGRDIQFDKDNVVSKSIINTFENLQITI